MQTGRSGSLNAYTAVRGLPFHLSFRGCLLTVDSLRCSGDAGCQSSGSRVQPSCDRQSATHPCTSFRELCAGAELILVLQSRALDRPPSAFYNNRETFTSLWKAELDSWQAVYKYPRVSLCPCISGSQTHSHSQLDSFGSSTTTPRLSRCSSACGSLDHQGPYCKNVAELLQPLHLWRSTGRIPHFATRQTLWRST